MHDRLEFAKNIKCNELLYKYFNQIMSIYDLSNVCNIQNVHMDKCNMTFDLVLDSGRNITNLINYINRAEENKFSNKYVLNCIQNGNNVITVSVLNVNNNH